MEIAIELPPKDVLVAEMRERWEDVCADEYYRNHPGRVETNQFGEVIMSPPHKRYHSKQQFKLIQKLVKLLPHGEAIPEMPLLTADGVRAMDVGWYSSQRENEMGEDDPSMLAPEICVEVISPRNTSAELAHKRDLYFEAGAEEVWFCQVDGTMTFFHKASPLQAKETSHFCQDFPQKLEI